MIGDALFFDFSRGRNPGVLVGGDYTDTDDMAGNLLILYALTVGIEAQTVLEIGVNDGTSTLAFLKALHETGGKLTSVDIAPCPVAEALVKRFNYESRWRFVQQSSHEFVTDEQFDIVFVDGDHSAEGSRSDVRRFSPNLTPGGILLLHDCLMGESGSDGVLSTSTALMRGHECDGCVLPFSAQLGIFRRSGEWITRRGRSVNE